MADPSAWRIDKAKWEKESFTGAGAAAEGGRWNASGVQVVYCSEHLAMAAQEKFIHLPKSVPPTMRFIKFRIDFNGAKVERVAASALPPDWREFPAPAVTQEIGDEWVTSRRTAVLAVPSAIIPEEENYLLNPAHPDFSKLTIHPAESFTFDPRLATLSAPPPAKR